MSDSYRRYVELLEEELERLYAISEKARAKGYDPSLNTECKIAKDLADLVEGLVGPPGIATSIRDLSTKLPREELAFKIVEEIVHGKFGHMEPEIAADQALRTALAIFTEGLTAAPLQGISKVSIRMNNDRTRYLAVYFAGPMRAAGGTDQALTVVVADFVRRLLGLDRYKPTREEIERFVEEIRLYERSVTKFQYHITDEELRKALQWTPIEVTGKESNSIEVSSYRNLSRIETNCVRGGALRVVNDGIVGRAPKVLAIIEKLAFQGWNWLRDIRGKSEKKANGFMDDVIAGRPIFCFPSARGGFRLRYGRARNTGLSAVGVHPATMLVLQGFLAGGTQIRLELPSKGGITVPVDTIEPPVVRLKDGSVRRVSVEDFAEIKQYIERILFVGDLLISFGDFLYNNKVVPPSGYVEEWWIEDLRRVIAEKFNGRINDAADSAGIPPDRLREFVEKPFTVLPKAKEAVALAKALRIPLHPHFTFFWEHLKIEEYKLLREWVLAAEFDADHSSVDNMRAKNEPNVKQAMEKLCLPHKLVADLLVVEGEDAYALAVCVGLKSDRDVDISSCKSVLDAVRQLSKLQINKKAPTFVGARMGRPEKAKRREMKPNVHILFPVGMSGGVHRDLVEAAKRGPAFVEVVKRKCPKCGYFTFRVKCTMCDSETVPEESCPRCGRSLRKSLCPACKLPAIQYQKQALNFKKLLDKACTRLGVSAPKLVKGVKGLTNASKTPEIVEKGILRAIYDLSVYKDGTIRFDATNAPLTHFKPDEIGVSVQKLRKLGYTCAADGSELAHEDQICELKVQDIIIPQNNAEYFLRVAKFIDELLNKVYALPAYYHVRQAEDLIGHLVVGLAPHTCAGIVGRIVGFTSLSLCYAHPIWHSAKRRDCDGDEDAVMLALDTFVNFSRIYLPAQIGGIMDAPLLLVPVVNTKEVQRQAYDLDVAGAYSLQFYEKTLESVYARQISPIVDLVGSRLGTAAQFEAFGFTVPVSDINAGNAESMYKRFKTMIEKMDGQLGLAEKISAVNARKVALKVLTTHFMRDIAGNIRAFSTQAFRCKVCNKRYRRIPLRGKCSVCGGQLTLTVYRGGIEKYLDVAHYLVQKYELAPYYGQRITLMKEEIEAMFNSKKPRQISLAEFA